MEGYSEESASSTKKEDDDKPKKKATTFGLGKSTFEFANKKDKAEKIAEAPLWEKLIPKDGGESPKLESPLGLAESSTVEKSDIEATEEAPDLAVENLSPGETTEVRKQVAREESAELKQGRSDDEDPDQAAGREQAIEYLDTIAAEAENAPIEPVESFAAVTAVGGEALSAVESEPSEMLEAGTGELELTPAEFEHGQEIQLNPPAETSEVVDESETEATVPPVSTGTAANSAATTGRTIPNPNALPGASAGNGNQPPVPPNAPPVNSGGPNGSNNSGANFNFGAPAAPNQNMAPPTTRVEYVRDTRNEGAYFLAGGILGYMLGRRRGRIKTEKRLKAVSKKLEQQISEVRQEVVQQATVIREQARQRYNQEHQPPQVTRSAESTPRRSEVAVRQPETTPKRKAEAAASTEQVRTMDHQKVLAMAEKVVIDGTSLRTIYESKQITEPGLRRITSEYISGGDLQAALKHEIEIKEMQYERDPQMRDRLAASYAGVDAAQPQASQQSMANLNAHVANPTRSEPRDNKQKSEADAQATKERAKQVFVSAWVVFIVVLVIAAVMLGSR